MKSNRLMFEKIDSEIVATAFISVHKRHTKAGWNKKKATVVDHKIMIESRQEWLNNESKHTHTKHNQNVFNDHT